MKLPLKTALLTAVFSAAGMLNAQHYTIPATNCGHYGPNYHCPNMQITGADELTTGIFYEPVYNGRLKSIGLRGRDGLGTFLVTSIIDVQTGSTHTQTVNAVWYDEIGTQYNLTSTITYQTYYSRGGGGKGGGGAGTFWNEFGGTLDVIKNQY